MNKAVVFDFYGVLFPNTYWALADFYCPDMDKNIHKQLQDIIRSSDRGEISQNDMWLEVIKIYGVSLDELMQKKGSFGGLDLNLLKYVTDLKGKGVKTGIISNAGSGFVEGALANESYLEAFNSIIVSGDVGVVKPSHEIFMMSVEALSVQAKDCLFFDDIQRNVDAAREFGMQAHLYEGLSDCKLVVQNFLDYTDTDK